MSPKLLLIVFLVYFVCYGYCKNITDLFGKEESERDVSQPIYLQLSQINYFKKIDLKIYFSSKYLYIISHISAEFTSHLNENSLCAFYRVGLKTFSESQQKSNWNSLSPVCNCLHPSGCQPPKLIVFKREPQQPLNVEIEAFKKSDYESWANITLIPAIEQKTGDSCKSGMKPYNHTTDKSSILLCPVYFNEADVPLIKDKTILSWIGEKPNEKGNSSWGIWVALIVLVILIIAAILFYFFYIRADHPDSADCHPLLEKGSLLDKCKKDGEVRMAEQLSVYSLPLREVCLKDLLFKTIDVPELWLDLKRDEFTIMLVGLKDHGKNTLICALLNFLYGVEFANDYRFELKKTKSMKSDVITYEIMTSNRCDLGKVVVNVVDVPSFTSDTEDNEKILDKVRSYSQRGYFIDALCIIAKGDSNLPEDTMYDLYREVVDCVKASGVYLLNTFVHDGKAPTTEHFIQRGIIKSENYSRKIKNEVLFEDPATAYESDWAGGMRSIKRFCNLIIENQLSLASRIAEQRTSNHPNSKSGRFCILQPDVTMNGSIGKYNLNLEERFGSYYYLRLKSLRLAFVGFQDAGKHSFIDSLINMNYRLKYREINENESNILKLFKERPTHLVSHYQIPALVGSKLNFPLELYDLKSFNMANNNEDNEKVLSEIQKLLENNEIHAICFIVSSDQEYSGYFKEIYDECGKFSSLFLSFNISQTKKNKFKNMNDLECYKKFKINNSALVDPSKTDVDDFERTVASFNVLFDDLAADIYSDVDKEARPCKAPPISSRTRTFSKTAVV